MLRKCIVKVCEGDRVHKTFNGNKLLEIKFRINEQTFIYFHTNFTEKKLELFTGKNITQQNL